MSNDTFAPAPDSFWISALRGRIAAAWTSAVGLLAAVGALWHIGQAAVAQPGVDSLLAVAHAIGTSADAGEAAVMAGLALWGTVAAAASKRRERRAARQ